MPLGISAVKRMFPLTRSPWALERSYKPRNSALLAWGESKAAILREAIEGPQIDSVPRVFSNAIQTADAILTKQPPEN